MQFALSMEVAIKFVILQKWNEIDICEWRMLFCENVFGDMNIGIVNH